MRKALLLCLCLLSAVCATGADKKEKPLKVSELLESANDMMAEAQEAYMDGEAKQAIELYRKALAEIERVEGENPDRALSAEFAPLRFRKALCETEIDRIMLEDVSGTARTVAVTDTAELEKKRAERKQAVASNTAPETVSLSARKSAEEKIIGENKEKEEKEEAASIAPEAVGDELEFAKDLISVDRLAEAEKSLIKILKASPDNRETMFLLPLVQLRLGRPDDATILIEDLLEDNPSDESALLLGAAAHTAAGHLPKALDLLDAAMRANPKRPEGYHNTAWVLLEMNPKTTSDAEAYYRQSIKLGGARDRDLERRLGIKE